MTSMPVLQLSLRYSAIFTLVVALAGAVCGLVLDGLAGLVSALIGTVVAAVFMGLTAVSILVAERATRGRESTTRYFVIVVAAWIIKVAVFVGVAILAGSIAWLNPYVYFISVVVAVVGSLVADGLAMQRARVPYVGDIELPGASTSPNPPSDGR